MICHDNDGGQHEELTMGPADIARLEQRQREARSEFRVSTTALVLLAAIAFCAWAVVVWALGRWL